jgi:DNA-binding NtrC family response regulator
MVLLDHVEVALIVEDDFLIAVDMEEQLKRLGCREISMANTVKGALLAIEEGVQFVVLDVSLSNEPCTPVAQKLTELGIPFIYFTGYPQDNYSYAHLPSASWLAKPASEVDLVAAISTALSKAWKPPEPAAQSQEER